MAALPGYKLQEHKGIKMMSSYLMQAHVFHDTPGASPGPGPDDVEITARVAPDAVTRAEARVTPLRQTLTFQG